MALLEDRNWEFPSIAPRILEFHSSISTAWSKETRRESIEQI